MVRKKKREQKKKEREEKEAEKERKEEARVSAKYSKQIKIYNIFLGRK